MARHAYEVRPSRKAIGGDLFGQVGVYPDHSATLRSCLSLVHRSVGGLINAALSPQS